MLTELTKGCQPVSSHLRNIGKRLLHPTWVLFQEAGHRIRFPSVWVLGTNQILSCPKSISAPNSKPHLISDSVPLKVLLFFLCQKLSLSPLYCNKTLLHTHTNKIKAYNSVGHLCLKLRCDFANKGPSSQLQLVQSLRHVRLFATP